MPYLGMACSNLEGQIVNSERLSQLLVGCITQVCSLTAGSSERGSGSHKLLFDRVPQRARRLSSHTAGSCFPTMISDNLSDNAVHGPDSAVVWLYLPNLGLNYCLVTYVQSTHCRAECLEAAKGKVAL